VSCGAGEAEGRASGQFFLSRWFVGRADLWRGLPLPRPRCPAADPRPAVGLVPILAAWRPGGVPDAVSSLESVVVQATRRWRVVGGDYESRHAKRLPGCARVSAAKEAAVAIAPST
jgi:hypothetical protein